MQTEFQQPQGFATPPTYGMVYLPQPVRFLDTRSSGASANACNLPAAVIGTDTDNLYNARIRCTGIPAKARGIFGNITIINMSANGFLTMYPDSSLLLLDWSSTTKPVTNRPFVATVNYRTAVAVQNQPFSIGLGKNGKFWIYNTTTTTIDVILDIVGYVV